MGTQCLAPLLPRASCSGLVLSADMPQSSKHAQLFGDDHGNGLLALCSSRNRVCVVTLMLVDGSFVLDRQHKEPEPLCTQPVAVAESKRKRLHVRFSNDSASSRINSSSLDVQATSLLSSTIGVATNARGSSLNPAENGPTATEPMNTSLRQPERDPRPLAANINSSLPRSIKATAHRVNTSASFEDSAVVADSKRYPHLWKYMHALEASSNGGESARRGWGLRAAVNPPASVCASSVDVSALSVRPRQLEHASFQPSSASSLFGPAQASDVDTLSDSSQNAKTLLPINAASYADGAAAAAADVPSGPSPTGVRANRARAERKGSSCGVTVAVITRVVYELGS